MYPFQGNACQLANLLGVGSFGSLPGMILPWMDSG